MTLNKIVEKNESRSPEFLEVSKKINSLLDVIFAYDNKELMNAELEYLTMKMEMLTEKKRLEKMNLDK